MVSVAVKKYDLPDSYLYDNNIDIPLIKVWIPENICIVLGRSNNPTDSLFTENVLVDRIPIYKRPSGGETVVLSNKMIILSIVVKQTDFKSGKSYFKNYNTKIISALKGLGIKDLGYNGISDITINDLKILGSSIYQNKFVVFYHAVLNVGESVSLIDKYLKHPKLEPDYRNNRNHKNFVTSLAKENYNVDIDEIKIALEKGLSNLQF